MKKRKTIENKQIIAVCKKHGECVHRLPKDGYLRCAVCQSERDKKRDKKEISLQRREYNKQYARERRKDFKHKMINRLRVSLKNYSKGKLHLSKNLSFSGEELCEHLSQIHENQKGICPMCDKKYSECGFDIDHIIPLSTAQNLDEITNLFTLKNLSLLCPDCNQHVKGTKIL